ncbi:hypothetical protein HZA97_07155 [Candidatus Woesearchaeota archaeon]|nr:hypothetical protein [Candidatus Woesearchaeota archaeon]
MKTQKYQIQKRKNCSFDFCFNCNKVLTISDFVYCDECLEFFERVWYKQNYGGGLV